MSDGAARNGQGQGTRQETVVTQRPRFARIHDLGMAFGASVVSALQEEAKYGHGFLWVPVAMAAGAAFWFAAEQSFAIWPMVVLFLVSGLGAFFCRHRPFLRFTLVLICAGSAGISAAAFETWRHDTTLLDDSVTTRIFGTVVHRDIDARDRRRYTIVLEKTEDPTIRRPPERIRVLARNGHDPIEIGDRISGVARLQPPSGPALPGTFDFAFNAYFQGLGAYGFFYGAPQRLETAGAAKDNSLLMGARLQLARLRQAISHRIRTLLPGDAGAFAAALTVADRRAMSEEAVEALRASGLAHVLAISGLHMALVAGTVFVGVRILFGLFPVTAQSFPVKKLAAVVALLVATAYLFLSGASVSTQRAWLMLAIMLVAVLLDRPALTLRNVALAAICIIVLTPSAVVGPGFQMSFAATAALVAVYSAWRHRGGTLGVAGRSPGGASGLLLAFIAGLAITAVVAGLATAPFAAYHFHRIASLGLMANLLAMPIVTFLIMPFGLIALILMPVGIDHLPLQTMGFGLELVLAVAKAVESLGGMVVTGQVAEWMFLSLVAGLLLLILARSWLRLLGLPFVLTALMAPLLLPPSPEPEVLISEDGRLVSLVNTRSLATNRTRPSDFLLEQWQRALRRPTHLGPQPLTGEWDFAGLDPAGQPLFFCRRGELCLARTASGRTVAVIDDLTLLGAACDRADVVITRRRIAMNACRSGALLVTGRMLRQTGAVAIYADKDGKPKITTAMAQVRRPWSVHRHYDWRTRSFIFETPSWAGNEKR